MSYTPSNTSQGLGYRPPPKPLPSYDPQDEPPKWNWRRLMMGPEPIQKAKEYTPVGTQPKSPDDPDWRGVIKNNVREYETPENYKMGLWNDPKYFWFDTPDYADPFKKLWYSFKFFTKMGVAVAAFQAGLKIRRNPDTKYFLGLAGRYVVPTVAAGMAASITVVTLANLRNQKDDYWNYAFAGFAFASVLGRKCHLSHTRWLLFSVPSAVLVKHNAEINGLLYPRANPRMRAAFLHSNTGKNGITDGDLRLGIRGHYGDQGRDVRTFV